MMHERIASFETRPRHPEEPPQGGVSKGGPLLRMTEVRGWH